MAVVLGFTMWRNRRALGRGWRAARGKTGKFRRAENSDRSRALTAAWAAAWGGPPDPLEPPFSMGDRWVRFHSLPASQRYAETPAEYREILRRQYTLLAELMGDLPRESLIVIALDWDGRDITSGWSRRLLPAAWPWQEVPDEEGFSTYLWVQEGITAPQLERLLLGIADDEGRVVLVPPDLRWCLRPYDGGVDVVLPDAAARDALRDRHRDWLPSCSAEDLLAEHLRYGAESCSCRAAD